MGVRKGDRVALYMQNCPQFIVSVYGILRADAVVVPVNPMNRADEFSHYITDPQSKAVVCSADLAGFVAQANRALPEAERVPQVLVTRYTDAMPDGPLDPAEAPSALLETWLRAEHPLPEGQTRWADALAAAPPPPPHTAEPDDLALLPYTSGTTGLPKGCMHTHRTLMHNAVSGQWSHSGPETVGLGVVPMFHITGMMLCVLGAVHAGATTVLMPRWDRELAGRLISRYRITHWTCIPTMVIDLFASAQLQELRPGQPAQHRRRRRGHAAGRGAAADRRVRPDLRRRLRPDRDRCADAQQPAGARQAAVPGHPLSSAPMRGWWTRSHSRSCRWARPAKSSCTARRSSRATGATPRPPRPRSSSSRASASFAPATWAAWTRRATSSSPTGSSA